ncbi:hypothetical protein SCALM49S_04989 [Streptomyces californicus]
MAILQGATDTWTKSSYSGGNGACVEVKSPAQAIASTRLEGPQGPSITFIPGAWNAFVRDVAAGTVDA